MPCDTTAAVARQRWVLAQISPPLDRAGSDIFVEVLRAIRGGGETNILEEIVSNTPGELDFPHSMRLFAVIDEAQVAAQGEKGLEDHFRSEREANSPPILREIIRYFDGPAMFSGVIIAAARSSFLCPFHVSCVLRLVFFVLSLCLCFKS